MSCCTGAFIQVGNEDGDDYLAELDYIEVVERMKEDYESDVEDDSEDSETQEKNDDEFRAGGRFTSGNNTDDTYRYRTFCNIIFIKY